MLVEWTVGVARSESWSHSQGHCVWRGLCNISEMGDDPMAVTKKLTTSHVPSISALSDFRIRRVYKRVFSFKNTQWTAHFRQVDGTYIRVDTADRNSEHAVEICVREDDESHQISHAEDRSKETCLDSTANKSVEHCICLAETGS